MDVKDFISFPEYPNYSIEWGHATWTEDEAEDDKDWSIRNRYNKEDGGFNVRGSSEIPWEDFKRMISESIKRNHFSNAEIAKLLEDISKYILKT